jgi:hypothetical protein
MTSLQHKELVPSLGKGLSTFLLKHEDERVKIKSFGEKEV